MSRSNQKHNSLELTILVAFKNMTFSLNNCVFYYIALAQKLGVSPKRKQKFTETKMPPSIF